MIISRIANHNLKQTLSEIERMVNTYYADMKRYSDYSIYQMFDFIAKTINYKKDPDKTELVMRPSYTLKRRAGDCDDKTIVFLSWMKLKKIPCGYSIVSEKADKPYHHIFPFAHNKNTGIIIDLDATYASGKIGKIKDWPRRQNYYIG